jgi:hypothetical protein
MTYKADFFFRRRKKEKPQLTLNRGFVSAGII